ncbi:MAG: hypothetical protein BWZ10_01074 [candidate division BRC1 bacterium ADurb.BinA364]|nr:MAG: hypothetical protein BWZ10_01074 [candidate division BRC1 bacterium ADurb.BinA364]
MSREWGYEFFKIDGLSHNNSSYSALFYERPQVRAAFRRPCENPLERCVKACRQGMGPDRYFLACRGFHNGPEAALADATRIGGDVVQPHKPVTWEGYLSQARMTLARLFSHNIQWHSDPDTLLVGTAAPLAAARTAATVVALPGQLMFAGDKLMELPEERMRLLQRCLPVCPVRPLDLFPIMRLKPVWTLKIRRDFGAWDVVSLFNFRDDEPCEAAVGMEELGLDPAKRYWVWDFWADKLLGAKRGELRLKLKPMANALLAVHEDLGRPQFLSTDRHLTQGGVSLTALEWDAAKLELRGETQLVAGEATTLALLCPPPYRPLEASSEGAAAGAALERAKNVLRLRLKPRATGDARWTVRFALMP